MNFQKNLINREEMINKGIIPIYKKEKLEKLIIKENIDISNLYLNTREINILEVDNKSFEKIKSLILIKEKAEEISNIIEKLEKNIEKDDYFLVKLIDYIIEYAILTNSSDIHFEGSMEEVIVRVRTDGVLNNLCKLNKIHHQRLISRIKILANLDYTIKNIPQDSRFTYEFKNENIDIRVATTPTVFNEKIVLRILDKSKVEYTKEGIGLFGDNLIKVNKLLKQPSGIILSVGPTGSGKSSTIYTLLEDIKSEDINIMTIEDPVEYKISGINQMNIDEKSGFTFEKGLEAILRLDPDKIMLGEIRNAQAARTAFRASITGRMIFSTLHTSDCPSTIIRLQDMGVENYLISAGLMGIISQRLVRKLCTCKKEVQEYVDIYNEELKFYKPVGCEKCNKGYSGRIAVFEILILNQELKEAINKNKPLEELNKLALKSGMIPLKNELKKLLLKGDTSLDEIYKNIITLDN